jgi:hypothetical protein
VVVVLGEQLVVIVLEGGEMVTVTVVLGAQLVEVEVEFLGGVMASLVGIGRAVEVTSTTGGLERADVEVSMASGVLLEGSESLEGTSGLFSLEGTLLGVGTSASLSLEGTLLGDAA